MDAEVVRLFVTFFVLIFVVGVPVLGFTARYALKPIVESIVRLREAFVRDTLPDGVTAADVRRIDRELGELKDQMKQLAEAAEFDRKLLGPDD